MEITFELVVLLDGGAMKVVVPYQLESVAKVAAWQAAKHGFGHKVGDNFVIEPPHRIFTVTVRPIKEKKV